MKRVDFLEGPRRPPIRSHRQVQLFASLLSVFGKFFDTTTPSTYRIYAAISLAAASGSILAIP